MPEHDPSLDAIMRTDRFVDALASGARMSPVDPLSAMLGGWRDDVRSRPDTQVVTLVQASAALAKTQKPPRRNRFGLTAIGAAAAAVLCIGGFGAVVYDAGPGDALYGLRSMLFGESTKTRDDAVALASQQLAQVRQLVQEGNWDEAQQRLVTLSTTVQSVDDVAAQQQLVEQYNALTVQVIERNPEATLPPPGEPLPPLPSSPLTFLTVPAIQDRLDIDIDVRRRRHRHAETPPVSTPLPTPTAPTLVADVDLARCRRRPVRCRRRRVRCPRRRRPSRRPARHRRRLPTATAPSPTANAPLPTPAAPSPTAVAPVPLAAAATHRDRRVDSHGAVAAAAEPVPTALGRFAAATRRPRRPRTSIVERRQWRLRRAGGQRQTVQRYPSGSDVASFSDASA